MRRLFKKGERRPVGAGRKKGTPNKAAFLIREAAQQHGADILERLVELATHRDGRIAIKAAELILAYAYGKPTEYIPYAAQHGQSTTVAIYLPDNGRNSEQDCVTIPAQRIDGPLETTDWDR
jgi:hypothetical protein